MLSQMQAPQIRDHACMVTVTMSNPHPFQYVGDEVKINLDGSVTRDKGWYVSLFTETTQHRIKESRQVKVTFCPFCGALLIDLPAFDVAQVGIAADEKGV